MNGLIDRIESNDPDFVTLTLTMECETVDELGALIRALEKNTTLQQVAFRGSFFPLRNIRRHLPWNVFLQMLEAVGTKAVQYLFLPPTMMGMVRGQTASHLLYFNNACLQEFRANEALTFGTLEDVEDLAQCLGECRQLRSVELGDSFFNRSSRRISEHMMDALFMALADLPELRQVEMSSHYEQQLSARTPALLSSQALLYFLQQSAAASSSSSSSLQLLNISRMGLDDAHFEAIATFFSTPPPPPTATSTTIATATATADETTTTTPPTTTNTAESSSSSSSSSSLYTSSQQEQEEQTHDQLFLRLCLDGNRPTQTGLVALFRSLRHNPPVQSISLRDIVSAAAAMSSVTIEEWSDTIFLSNLRLVELDVDEHDNARLLGGSTNNNNNNNNGGTVTEFWTQLNSLGKRQYWQEDSSELRSALWPLVLEDVSRIEGDPSFVWYVLRNFAQYII
jgi:hypothetical protein